MVRALRRHPVLYGIVALMVISWMAGMATGFDLSFRLVYLLAALVIITYTLSKLGAEADLRRGRTPAGAVRSRRHLQGDGHSTEPRQDAQGVG